MTDARHFNTDKLARFEKYGRDPWSSVLSEFAGFYLAETITAPETSVGSHWTCTALPKTGGGGRFFTINAGGLEVLYAYIDTGSSGEDRPWIAVNVHLPEGKSDNALTLAEPFCEAAPSSGFKREKVWTWRIDFLALIDDQDVNHQILFEVFDDHLDSDADLFALASRLNKRLMDRSRSNWISSHNGYLANDFLSRSRNVQLDGQPPRVTGTN